MQSSYNNYSKTMRLKALLLFLVVSATFIIPLKLFGIFEAFIALFVCLASLIIYYTIQVNRSKKELYSFFKFDNKIFDTNLLQEKTNNKWKRGTLIFNNKIIPCWIKVTSKGIEVVLCVLSKQNTTILSWDLVSSIKHETLTVFEHTDLYVQVNFMHYKDKVFLPWEKNFDLVVPNSVGILK